MECGPRNNHPFAAARSLPISDKTNNHPERRTMSLVRIALSLLGAVLVVFVTATPAFAHTELKNSEPTEGSSLSTTPTQVSLTFEEAVTLPAEPISVTGPDGSSWTVGPASIAGASVTAPVEATGPAGQYTLRYTVIADDGDEVTGAVRFTMSTAATPSATPSATATEAQAVVTAAAPVAAVAPTAAATPAEAAGSSGSSGWAWVAVAIVVVGVLAALGLAWTRRSSRRRVS
jgi:methionine-rich copper-binding protein CopC